MFTDSVGNLGSWLENTLTNAVLRLVFLSLKAMVAVRGQFVTSMSLHDSPVFSKEM